MRAGSVGDWKPTPVLRVSYTTRGLPPKEVSTSGLAYPRTPPLIVGLALKSAVNMADGFCMLDQIAGAGSWHVAALGTPIFDLSIWGWSLLALASVAVGYLADRLTGLRQPASGPRLHRVSFIAVVSGLLVGVLFRLAL